MDMANGPDAILFDGEALTKFIEAAKKEKALFRFCKSLRSVATATACPRLDADFPCVYT